MDSSTAPHRETRKPPNHHPIDNKTPVTGVWLDDEGPSRAATRGWVALYKKCDWKSLRL